jgi:hypothetical protein
MTEDELQKRMEFIIEQQAQLVVNQENAEERVTRLENAMSELAESQTHMIRVQEHMNEVVAVMADSQTRTDARLDTLIDVQIRTDERLDTFISVLERYISEDRNGKPE